MQSFKFKSIHFSHLCNDEADFERVLHLIECDNYTYFTVEKSELEWLDVVYTEKGCVIVHVKYMPEYCAYDASISEVLSDEKVMLQVDKQLTPFSTSLRLSKTTAREIIRHFCLKGEVSRAVYWIPEGPCIIKSEEHLNHEK